MFIKKEKKIDIIEDICLIENPFKEKKNIISNINSIDWIYQKIFVLFDWIYECQTIQITLSINDNLASRPIWLIWSDDAC